MIDANELIALASETKDTKEVSFRNQTLVVKGLAAYHALSFYSKMKGVIDVDDEKELTANDVNAMLAGIGGDVSVEGNPITFLLRHGLHSPMLDDDQAAKFMQLLSLEEMFELMTVVMDCTESGQEENEEDPKN